MARSRRSQEENSMKAGDIIGSYRVLEKLGEGGMGEVYRARDHKLNRDVALKIVSPAVLDSDRLQRFVREAQSLAALNHPHIAQIYGLEDSTDTRALVMELVEGEDLAQRLARGPLPLDEALPIGRQIAEALEAAHEVGIVHRDLKPANVKVRADGTVKVLDFGLAKALDTADGRRQPADANTPTFTSPAVTQAGIILGTAAYMSPEQARGRPVDKRADIWAFGVVLFEMITGRVCFAGETVTDVLAGVVSRDPDWSALPPGVSPGLIRLLKRCTEKDQRVRLRDIGEARVALTMPETADVATSARPLARRPFTARVMPWVVAGLALAIAAAGWLMRPASPTPLRKLELALPSDGFGFALAPDGQRIAYRSQAKVLVSDLEHLEQRSLADSTPSARNAIFWSPDARFIGYNDADGRLWSVPATGGTPRLICTIPETRQLMGAAWLTDGSIVFSVWRGSLYKVAAAGGQASPLITIDPKKEIDVHEVVGLPDGRLIVATHLNTEDVTNLIYRIEIVGPASRELAFDAPLFPIARTPNGYLLMRRVDANPGVWAFRDTGRWPLHVEDGFLVAAGAEVPSASNDGMLLYSRSSSDPQMRELVWVDRAGQVIGHAGTEQAELSTPALSPDGQRVAFAARSGSNLDVHVLDLANNIPSRVTSEAEDQVLPSWFPGGRRLIFAEVSRTASHIVARNADGSGARDELGLGSSPSMAPDGRHVLFIVVQQGQGLLRYAQLSPDGSMGPAQKVFATSPEPDIRMARFSPDGRLIVYNERVPSSAVELSITRFPSGEGRWQVSIGGGRAPVWSRTGELFFAAGAGTGGPRQMMVAAIKGGEHVTVGSPVTLFSLPDDFDTPSAGPHYDVTADGKRLLMVRTRRAPGQSAVRWVLVQNWLSEFEK
jgi:hypothetical protein